MSEDTFYIPKIEEAMAGLQQIAAKNFGLTLRIGLVPVSELYAANRKLEIGRYEIVTGRCLAVFHGGGLSLAEKWIKQKNSKHLIDPKGYTKSMRTHADYRKFDDTLRMVIDISLEQSEAITRYLDSLYIEKLIFYGLHKSKPLLKRLIYPGRPTSTFPSKDGSDLHK
jgi:hypothetical protein